MAIDKVTSAAITDGTITSSDLASGAVQNQSAFKNIIINGDMSIAQRGTSITGINTNTYSLDRWITQGDDCTMTISQSTDVPTGQGFATSLKMDVTTANSSGDNGDLQIISQRIEGQMLQYLKKGTANAESLTLSFWCKMSQTGTYIVRLYDEDNDRHIAKSYTISSANTWEKKTITFAGDTTGAFGNDNGRSARLQWYLDARSDWTSGTLATSWESASGTNGNRAAGITTGWLDSTSSDFYLTGCQLEIGTSASDFEFLPHDVNLQRCQRYFYKLIDVPGGDANNYFTSGFMYSGSVLYSWNEFPTMMRTTPSLNVASGSNYYTFYRASAADNIDDFDLTAGRTNGAMIRNNSDVSGTGGDAGGIHSTSNSKITFSAEL